MSELVAIGIFENYDCSFQCQPAKISDEYDLFGIFSKDIASAFVGCKGAGLTTCVAILDCSTQSLRRVSSIRRTFAGGFKRRSQSLKFKFTTVSTRREIRFSVEGERGKTILRPDATEFRIKIRESCRYRLYRV